MTEEIKLFEPEISKNIKDRYQYVTDETADWTAVAIKGGKFNGVIYKYGKVTLAEEETEEGNLPFRFEYDILDPYGLEREEFDNEFFTLIGDILVDIIDEQMEESNFEYNPNDKHYRKSDN